MRIIHLISDKEWSEHHRAVATLHHALESEGHRSTVMCASDRHIIDLMHRAKIEKPAGELSSTLSFLNPARIARHLKGDASAIIAAHSIGDVGAALLARRLVKDRSRVKIVWHFHGFSPAGSEARWKEALRETDLILFPTDECLEKFMESGPDADASRLAVLHPAASCRKGQHETSPGTFTMIYSGHIDTASGLPAVLEAMERDHSLRLIAAGTGKGRYAMPVIRESRRLGTEPRIEWMGDVADTGPLMARADAAVVPATVRTDNTHLMAEFAAAGLPAITTEEGSQPTLSAMEVTFRKEDSPSLLQAVEKIRGAETKLSAACDGYNRYYTSLVNLYHLTLNKPQQ